MDAAVREPWCSRQRWRSEPTRTRCVGTKSEAGKSARNSTLVCCCGGCSRASIGSQPEARAMNQQEAVKWGVTGTAGTAGGLVDLSDVRRISWSGGLADNGGGVREASVGTVPVASGMFQERRAQAGSSGGSPGRGLSSWFGFKRTNNSATEAEGVMQRKSAEAAHYLGTKSSAHSGQVQVHPAAQVHARQADQPLWLRCIPDRCCACVHAPPPETPASQLGSGRARKQRESAEKVQGRL